MMNKLELFLIKKSCINVIQETHTSPLKVISVKYILDFLKDNKLFDQITVNNTIDIIEYLNNLYGIEINKQDHLITIIYYLSGADWPYEHRMIVDPIYSKPSIYNLYKDILLKDVKNEYVLLSNNHKEKR